MSRVESNSAGSAFSSYLASTSTHAPVRLGEVLCHRVSLDKQRDRPVRVVLLLFPLVAPADQLAIAHNVSDLERKVSLVDAVVSPEPHA